MLSACYGPFAPNKGISLLYILLLNQSKIILDLIFVSVEYAVCCRND